MPAMPRPRLRLSAFLIAAALPACSPTSHLTGYSVHQNITATMFWIGEKPLKGAPNGVSAWDEKWAQHFGGVDDPKSRDGLLPAAFRPLENPFYVALPYNDLARNGRKPDADHIIPWANTKPSWGKWQSMCKDRWVRITCGGKVCYAQWEDVGPFETDDAAYVFGDGSIPPKNKENQSAGIDVSPAVSAYLGIGGMGKVSWQFADPDDVPAGPWSEIVTRSTP
jgi:hypothetical protein